MHSINRVMLLLQLIITFQSQLDNTTILSRPRDVLEFVRHALEVSDTAPPVPSQSGSGTSKYGTSNERRKGLLKEDLRFVPDEQDTMETGEDSDDEVEVEDMVETAVGLLLAVLEGSSLFATSRMRTDSAFRIFVIIPGFCIVFGGKKTPCSIPKYSQPLTHPT